MSNPRGFSQIEQSGNEVKGEKKRWESERLGVPDADQSESPVGIRMFN